MEDHHIKGSIFSILAALSTALMATFVKFAVGSSVFTLLFFRNIISLFLILPLFFRSGLSLKTRKPLLHFFRAIMGFSGICCYFYSVQHLQLTQAMLLSNTLPLYIPFVAYFWLKTPITKTRLLSVFIGFIGVVMLLQPGYGLFKTAAIFVGLFGAICTAVSFVSVKQLIRTEKAERILFYYFAYSIVFSVFPMLLSASPQPSGVTWIYIAFIGIFAVLYQFLFTQANAVLAATKVAALRYMAVIFGALIDWIVWGHQLYPFEAFGGVLIIIGGLLALLDRKIPLRLGKRPPK